ncbi:MAG: hypothetical protein Q9170_008277 [Blastenia crenularia]
MSHCISLDRSSIELWTQSVALVQEGDPGPKKSRLHRQPLHPTSFNPQPLTSHRASPQHPPTSHYLPCADPADTAIAHKRKRPTGPARSSKRPKRAASTAQKQKQTQASHDPPAFLPAPFLRAPSREPEPTDATPSPSNPLAYPTQVTRSKAAQQRRTRVKRKMDPTKRTLTERPNTRGQKKAADQLDLNNPPLLTTPTSPYSLENGNGNGNDAQGRLGSSDRGGEATRGRARNRGQQTQAFEKERERSRNQKSTRSARDTVEAGPSTPARHPGLGLGQSPIDTPAPSASSEEFARPRSYFEGVQSISTRSQSESPSKSSASSIRTNKLKKSRSQSPAKSIAKQLTNAQLTMASLMTCSPSIQQRNPSEAQRIDGKSIPPAVHAFMRKLPKGTPGFVPRGLKSLYDEIQNSPTSYREAPDETEYSADFWKDLSAEKIKHLGTIVDEVTESADTNLKTGAIERHWGASTVAPLLAEIRRLPSLANVRYYNIEDCSIEPGEIRPVRLQPLKGSEDETLGEPLTDYARVATAKMVDWTLGLTLTDYEHGIIQRAYISLRDNGRSLNQTMGFVKDVPLFCDFEIKRLHSDVPPEFQIGVWGGAKYLKCKLHGWDTKIPMLGICVEGYTWNLYVLYETDDYKLTMMGPNSIGSTVSRNGVFRILHTLRVIASWGNTEFYDWFSREILAWCAVKSGDY